MARCYIYTVHVSRVQVSPLGKGHFASSSSCAQSVQALPLFPAPGGNSSEALMDIDVLDGKLEILSFHMVVRRTSASAHGLTS